MRPHLLIVDDDAVAATALRELSLEFGFGTADVAGGALEALEALDRTRPNALVLDINLNGRKSYEVAARAAKLGVPFAFLSGYGRNDIPLEYLKVPVLEKPYSPDSLRRVLLDLTGCQPAAGRVPESSARPGG